MLKIKLFEEPNPQGSGISLSQGEAKGVPFLRIGITEKGIVEYFGGALQEADALALTIDPTKGKNHLLRIAIIDADDPDGLAVRSGMKGSVYLKLMPWTQVSPGKRPAKALPVVARPDANSVLVKLPDWVRPPEQKIGQGRSVMGE